MSMVRRKKVLIIINVFFGIGFIMYLLLHTYYNPETKPRNIFFVETSKRNTLRGRVACAVESAARIHPEHGIIFMHLEPKWNNDDPMTLILKHYSNVIFQPINLKNILSDTSIETWAERRPWEKSIYKKEYLSDILRLILLLKYGGIYLDSDLVVMKSLVNLRNTAGSESPNAFSCGVMMFDKGNSFLKVAADIIRNVTNWNEWGIIGPALYKRVLLEKCHIINLVSLRNISHCGEMNVPTLLPKQAFYPIHFKKWRMYFDPKEANAVLALLKESYLVHYWNRFSTNEPIKIGSGQPIELLAKKFCPNVYKMTKQSNGIL